MMTGKPCRRAVSTHLRDCVLLLGIEEPGSIFKRAASCCGFNCIEREAEVGRAQLHPFAAEGIRLVIRYLAVLRRCGLGDEILVDEDGLPICVG